MATQEGGSKRGRAAFAAASALPLRFKGQPTSVQNWFGVAIGVSMCNYQANQLCCEAADTAMQVHGGLGYSRYKPFEHIYRHHRRYRITEGADEIQKRRIAGYMFGFMSQQKPKGVS